MASKLKRFLFFSIALFGLFSLSFLSSCSKKKEGATPSVTETTKNKVSSSNDSAVSSSGLENLSPNNNDVPVSTKRSVNTSSSDKFKFTTLDLASLNSHENCRRKPIEKKFNIKGVEDAYLKYTNGERQINYKEDSVKSIFTVQIPKMNIDIVNHRAILDSISDQDLKKKLPTILHKTFPIKFTGLINKYGFFGNSNAYNSLLLQSTIPDLQVGKQSNFELTDGLTELQLGSPNDQDVDLYISIAVGGDVHLKPSLNSTEKDSVISDKSTSDLANKSLYKELFDNNFKVDFSLDMTLKNSGLKKDFRDPMRQYVSILHHYLKGLIINPGGKSGSPCAAVNKADAKELLDARKSLQSSYGKLKTLKTGEVTFKLDKKISSSDGASYIKLDAYLKTDLSEYNPFTPTPGSSKKVGVFQLALTYLQLSNLDDFDVQDLVGLYGALNATLKGQGDRLSRFFNPLKLVAASKKMPKIDGMIDVEISKDLLKKLFYMDWEKKNKNAFNKNPKKAYKDREKAYKNFYRMLNFIAVTVKNSDLCKCTINIKQGALDVNNKTVPNIIASMIRGAFSLRG